MAALEVGALAYYRDLHTLRWPPSSRITRPHMRTERTRIWGVPPILLLVPGGLGVFLCAPDDRPRLGRIAVPGETGV